MESCQAPAYRWVKVNLGKRNFPPGALQVGSTPDGADVFAGRAQHDSELLPATVIPAKNACYLSHNGKEIQPTDFEMLVPTVFTWKASSNGNVPAGAFVIGATTGKSKDKGEKLYFGRVSHDGCITPGTVQPSRKACFYPFSGEEKSSTEYEVLVLE